MALPNSIDNTSPAGTDSPSLGDDQIRNLKTFIEDVFTIPNATNIAAAGFTFAAAGLTNVIFQNAAADPDAQGELQRNGTGASALKYYDGTAARILYMQSGTDVAVADGGTGLSSGTSGGVLAFTAAGTLASSAALTQNGVVYGGGAGAAPSVTAQGGTNTILTASAGAPSFSAAPIVNTSVQIGVASTATGSLILAHASSASLTTIQAGNATEANTYVWPADGGAANQVLTTDGATPTTALSWTTVSSGLTWAGGNTTEGTTTSTSAVSVVTVADLSIPATSPVLIIASFRRSAGAAAAVSLGLTVNATEVMAPASTGATSDEAESGIVIFFLSPRVASYLRGGIQLFAMDGAAGGNSSVNRFDADIPNATITTIIIRGLVGDAAVTLGVDEVHVYSLATS